MELVKGKVTKAEVVSDRRLDEAGLASASLELAKLEPAFSRVLDLYDIPPLWDRPSGFATLLQIILEQQVSLASAKACYDKLEAHLGSVSPTTVLSLSDAELKKVGFSRQKTSYARNLSHQIEGDQLDLAGLHTLSDAEAKAELKKVKGIGEWTSDIYLLMAMLRPDIMPRGDIALHSAWQTLSGGEILSADAFVAMAERWTPYRSVAARFLWHFYLEEKKIGKKRNLEQNIANGSVVEGIQ
jgi:DNA-3-methyladenine glycosylase II